MGKASRDKGARWERQVARMLRDAGIEARRGLGQARSASEVADVQVPGFWVECKAGGPALYPLRALRQAEVAEQADWLSGPEGRGSRMTPVAICKPDRKPATATWREQVRGVPMTVTVSLEDWIRMVAHQQRQGGE